MSQFIHVGFGNIVNTAKIIAVVSPDSAPIKRMVQTAREAGTAVLSALLPETIANRAQAEREDNDEA